MIRVVIADDQALVRAGFSVLVNSAEDLEVVGEAADGEQAIAVVRDTSPDVVLMDIRMPVMDGLQATEAITASDRDPPIRVLVLTTFDLDEYVFRALKAGASGFLLKDTPPNDLLNGIRVIAKGDAMLGPSVTRHLIEEYVRRPSPTAKSPPQLTGLTDREVEVLALLARGWSNQEISDSLYVTSATIKTHVSRLLMKLGARDRAQLIVIAYETGLVSAG
jgi:DNA-binding NarL/FixJ family response regulator